MGQTNIRGSDESAIRVCKISGLSLLLCEGRESSIPSECSRLQSFIVMFLKDLSDFPPSVREYSRVNQIASIARVAKWVYVFKDT